MINMYTTRMPMLCTIIKALKNRRPHLPYVALIKSPKDHAFAAIVHRSNLCREYSLNAPTNTIVRRPNGMPKACQTEEEVWPAVWRLPNVVNAKAKYK